MRADGLFSGDFRNLTLEYGNRYKEVAAGYRPDNVNKWTMFVKIADNEGIRADRLIRKVRYYLCEGFAHEYRDIFPDKNGRFEMTYVGWGTFEVEIEVHFKKELGMAEALELSHELVFDGAGDWSTINLPVKKENLSKVTGTAQKKWK